mmetsp:Transcript_21083/g.29766  ORF Transcript_21083/g.29766 Transcript_21083/m.29766 type:complete len:325 (+) Transcript_21083:119-1093(+)
MNTQQQDILASLEVMRMQEESTYQCSDYLFQQDNASSSNSMPQHQQTVDAECRYKMADWCFQVVDFCKFNRETVSIAMSFLDRYLSTDVGASKCLSSKKEFQLAAMTALYTAVKINEPEAMDPKVIAGLSRGVYTEDQVTDMELSILTALQWRMNPPTALSFVRAFFQLIPKDTLSESVQEAAFELARFQTELAISDYQYCTCKASTIAIAALANAFEGLEHHHHGGAAYQPKQYLQEFVAMTKNCHNLDELHQVQNALYVSISKANDTGSLSSKFSDSTNSSLQQKKTAEDSEQQTQQQKSNTIAHSSSPRSIRDQGMVGCMQ